MMRWCWLVVILLPWVGQTQEDLKGVLLGIEYIPAKNWVTPINKNLDETSFGELKDASRPAFSNDVNLILTWQFHQKWYAETGVGYSRLNYDSPTYYSGLPDTDTQKFRARYRAHYISVPLRIDMRVFRHYAIGIGWTTNFLTGADTRYTLWDADNAKSREKADAIYTYQPWYGRITTQVSYVYKDNLFDYAVSAYAAFGTGSWVDNEFIDFHTMQVGASLKMQWKFRKNQ